MGMAVTKTKNRVLVRMRKKRKFRKGWNVKMIFVKALSKESQNGDIDHIKIIIQTHLHLKIQS